MMRMQRILLGMFVLLLVGLLVQGPCSAALLWKSGFEAGTTLTTPESYSFNNSTFSGTDSSTGYSWPITLPFTNPTWCVIQNIFAFPDNPAPYTTTYYMDPEIETVTGPYGNPTKVLHMNHKEDIVGGRGVWQHQFKIEFSQEPPGLYMCHWIKYDTNLVSRCEADPWFWRNVWEMKACVPAGTTDGGCPMDMRIMTRILQDRDGTEGPCWSIKVDEWYTNGSPITIKQIEPIAMTAGELSKLTNGEWMFMETYFYRDPDKVDNGHFWWKIDGRTIVDVHDITFWGQAYKTQIFHMPFGIYGSATPTSENPRALWADDLEIHDSVPTGTPQAPVANFSGTPTSGAAPLMVDFTDSSTNTPTAWSWTFGDGSTSTAQNPSHRLTRVKGGLSGAN